MFSTFTGNSRRPRNVNLSGGAGNPFANTSWSPSAASNATKTVSNAQADRERRHAERQRQKAATKIQKTWRGHKDRTLTANQRRIAFDRLYSAYSQDEGPVRVNLAFTLILAFASSKPTEDDVRRLVQYAADIESMPGSLPLPPQHISRLSRLFTVITGALDKTIGSSL